MIASDRVRLDALIQQWEEQARQDEEDFEHESAYALKQCASDLRAVLLVLGDGRELEETKKE